MADEPQNLKQPDNKAPQPMFWLAFAALFGMLLLSIVALMMVSKNSATPQAVPQITITNASNNKSDPPTAAPASAVAPPAPAWRPDRAADPDAHRMSGQMAGAPQMLPGAVATPTIVAGKRDSAALAIRADLSPPYYETLSPSSHVKFRVRGMPGGPSGLNGPVPFRVHAWTASPDGRVASVEASVPGAEDRELYSYLPETAYKASKGKGRIMGLTVTNPRKTSVVNALRAPKGFQFLVADISAKNLSKESITVEPDMFEIQDSDRVPYLPNPELLSADFPQSAIEPKKSGKFTAAFLVPADASLVAVVAREPGDGLISSPLDPK